SIFVAPGQICTEIIERMQRTRAMRIASEVAWLRPLPGTACRLSDTEECRERINVPAASAPAGPSLNRCMAERGSSAHPSITIKHSSCVTGAADDLQYTFLMMCRPLG